MNPKITNFIEENNVLKFTISDINVCYVNALRRIILSDIPIFVFKTSPNEENKSIILSNTSRLHNEIIKQRLSCIPICIADINMDMSEYQLEVNVENNTDTIMMVTTKDFKIKNKTTEKYLSENETRKIFPPFIPSNGKDEYFIDFVSLRPKFSLELPGEKLNLTCDFSISTARYDASFNVSGTCSYGCTLNKELIKEKLSMFLQHMKDSGKSQQELVFEEKNWLLLEGKRHVQPNSFEFILETIGIYDNLDILIKACDILLDKFNFIKQKLNENKIIIEPSLNTLDNCFDITLENEDYTVGNILNHILYTIFYTDLKLINYISFKKLHPHDDHSIIRIAMVDNTQNKHNVKAIYDASIDEAIKNITIIHKTFYKLK